MLGVAAAAPGLSAAVAVAEPALSGAAAAQPAPVAAREESALAFWQGSDQWLRFRYCRFPPIHRGSDQPNRGPEAQVPVAETGR